MTTYTMTLENPATLFEVCKGYEDKEINLPKRKTKRSAGYDFEVAEDILIPPFNSLQEDIFYEARARSDSFINESYTLDEIAAITKKTCAKPTLVPTGIKCKMPPTLFLQLSVRSSCPLKHLLIMANGVGIIDSDYYNNPDNDGHIYFQIINLSPLPIILKKGDIIGQGIFIPYSITNDDNADGERTGGFGSTTK